MENIKVCVFDAYGTLFNFNSAVEKFKDEFGDSYNDFSKLWRSKQLEYSFLREIMGTYKDFFEITRDALEYAMEAFNIENLILKDKLMNAYLRLDTYKEVKSFLDLLEEKDIKKVILSNGSKKMLKAAVESSGISEKIDEAISVDEIKKFKPNRDVYEIIISKYKVSKNEVLFFSSNGWDIAGASNYGFNTIWINRGKMPIEKLDSTPNFIVNSLEESLSKF